MDEVLYKRIVATTAHGLSCGCGTRAVSNFLHETIVVVVVVVVVVGRCDIAFNIQLQLEKKCHLGFYLAGWRTTFMTDKWNIFWIILFVIG